jgi:hypothetical protein
VTERRSKASELVDDLMQRSPSAQARAERHPKVPELRLRADTPALEVTDATPVSDALEELRSQGLGTIALRSPDAEPTAVVLSVERYLELAGKELLNGVDMVARDGIMVPSESAFAISHVEQVNPNDTWHRQRS